VHVEDWSATIPTSLATQPGGDLKAVPLHASVWRGGSPDISAIDRQAGKPNRPWGV